MNEHTARGGVVEETEWTQRPAGDEYLSRVDRNYDLLNQQFTHTSTTLLNEVTSTFGADDTFYVHQLGDSARGHDTPWHVIPSTFVYGCNIPIGVMALMNHPLVIGSLGWCVGRSSITGKSSIMCTIDGPATTEIFSPLSSLEGLGIKGLMYLPVTTDNMARPTNYEHMYGDYERRRPRIPEFVSGLLSIWIDTPLYASKISLEDLETWTLVTSADENIETLVEEFVTKKQNTRREKAKRYARRLLSLVQ